MFRNWFRLIFCDKHLCKCLKKLRKIIYNSLWLFINYFQLIYSKLNICNLYKQINSSLFKFNNNDNNKFYSRCRNEGEKRMDSVTWRSFNLIPAATETKSLSLVRSGFNFNTTSFTATTTTTTTKKLVNKTTTLLSETTLKPMKYLIEV